MSDPIYTPILKTKRGEAKALTQLEVQVKRSIVPFFDILALKADTANGNDVHEICGGGIHDRERELAENEMAKFIVQLRT